MKRGYSLIELGVVLGVIAFIALTTLPTLNATSDSQALQTGATTVSRLLLDAKTRSLAPSEVTASASPAAYQVVFGPFENTAAMRTLTNSNSLVNTVELKSGSAVCEGAGSISGVKLLRSEKLPRNTYIEKVYPSNATVGGSSATIQFTVGKLGFQCGDVNRPEIESTSYVSGFWEGKNSNNVVPGADVISSRYAVITLASTKSAAKRYVYIDRQNSEIFVSKEDPQEFFTALGDTLAPQWPDGAESTLSFSALCGAASSRVNITFVRAVDYIGESDPGEKSVNAPVYYDISVGGQFVATSYYQAVSGESDVINYSYDSVQLGFGSYSGSVDVTITAKDGDGNSQEGQTDDNKKPLTKTFSTSCGNASTRSITNDYQTTSQNSPEIVNNNNHQSTQQQAGLD